MLTYLDIRQTVQVLFIITLPAVKDPASLYSDQRTQYLDIRQTGQALFIITLPALKDPASLVPVMIKCILTKHTL